MLKENQPGESGADISFNGYRRASFHGRHPSSYVDSGEEAPYFNRHLVAGPKPSNFRYLFKDLAEAQFQTQMTRGNFAATVAALVGLGELMVDSDGENDSNSKIPAGYTYWGQFIDHDLSAGTDRSHPFTITHEAFPPQVPAEVENSIRNMRTPAFDLDSVYGDQEGPAGGHRDILYGHEGDIAKLRIGSNDRDASGQTPPLTSDLQRDLPRDSEAQAQIGDNRNDENLLVAQFHLAMLRFHNAVVDVVRQTFHGLSDIGVFELARREVRFHYQWLVLNDFLRRICDPVVVDQIVAEVRSGAHIFNADDRFMPLEFSTAAYRFGHSMVRNNYDFNRNFGRSQSGALLPRASFSQLFAFTGNGAANNTNMAAQLPHNWIIEWDRFFFAGTPTELDGTPIEDRFARRIDTNLALELTEELMDNEGFDNLSSEEQALVKDVQRFNAIMQHLAKRNLLRGYLLNMPTGQALAGAMGARVLSPEELQRNNSDAMNEHLRSSGFLIETPLWFYILKEAELQGMDQPGDEVGGSRLGELGSLLVATVFVGLLDADPTSFLHAGDWTPNNSLLSSAPGAEDRGPILGIMDLLRFAGVAV